MNTRNQNRFLGVGCIVALVGCLSACEVAVPFEDLALRARPDMCASFLVLKPLPSDEIVSGPGEDQRTDTCSVAEFDVYSNDEFRLVVWMNGKGNLRLNLEQSLLLDIKARHSTTHPGPNDSADWGPSATDLVNEADVIEAVGGDLSLVPVVSTNGTTKTYSFAVSDADVPVVAVLSYTKQ